MSLRPLPVMATVVIVGVIAVLIVGRTGTPSLPGLGPKDGFGLPPTDLERVTVGSVAPDFSLSALSGDVVTLSDSRDGENVVLVFYRGHW